MRIVDLRSDTLTQPDEAMRKAMASAVVGDDVFGEDPTVRRLEELAAESLGKDAGMFVPSGTMGNQIALHLHTRPGDEVICDARSHIVHYEMGAMAALSGIQPRTLASPGGILDPALVEAAIAREIPYQSRTELIAVENTHNLAGGTVYPLGVLSTLVDLAKRHGMKIHMDGARVFNAAVASNTAAATIVAGFDSVTFCLSKGLGAPVGSILCGEKGWVLEARRVRKMLGGGMRQVGILAAAGILALQEGPARLAADHEHASMLVDALEQLPGLSVEPAAPRTNIVICTLEGRSAQELSSLLAAEGVLSIPLTGGKLRFVTHRDVDRSGILHAIAVLRSVMATAPANGESP